MGRISIKLVAVALLAVVSMSLVPILIRSTQANEITIGLVRLAIAILAITPVILIKKFHRQLSKSDWLSLCVVGLVFGGHWLSYFVAIKLSSAAIAAVALSTYGIHLLILNWLVKKQVVSLVEWLAVIACFLGCLLVAPEFDLGNELTLGLLIGIGSGFLYACLPLLHQRIIHIPTASRAWGQFLFASLIFLPLSGQSDWQLQIGDWWRLAVLGIVCTLVGHSLWVKVSSELPGVITGVIYYLYVPIAMCMAIFFLGEEINPSMILGAILIVGANILIALNSWKKLRSSY
ncbi:DMT family transporter [Aurantivibrio infirmus]